jgi:deazaflavin-dependent oxidoreductase (nitroreductase family)
MIDIKQTPQQIAGLTYICREDNIVVYQLDDARRDTTDAWVDLSRANDEAAVAENRWLYTLIILNIALSSPYLIQRGIKLASSNPAALNEVVAVVVMPGISATFLMATLNRLPSKTQQAVRIFNNQAEAIEWLHKRQQETAEFLYLTTTGHVSGNPHEIEIWFVAYHEGYYLIAEHEEKSHWVQNIQQNPAIKFRVGGHQHDGIARIVDKDQERHLVRAVSRLMDTKYKWSEGLIVELRVSDEDLH